LTRIRAGGGISNNLLSSTRVFTPVKTYNYCDLFKYKSLLKITLSMMMFWMVRFYVYFGLTLGLETISASGSFITYAISASSVA
jgi:hypothetical protein